MHRFFKLGLSLGSVFCLLTGPAWAQEDGSESTIMSSGTGRGSAVVEWNIDTFAEKPYVVIPWDQHGGRQRLWLIDV